MIPPCNTTSLPDVDASSSLPMHNAVSHKQVAPTSQDRCKHPLVDCWRLPAIGLDASRPPGVSSNVTVPTTISRSAYSASRPASLGIPTGTSTRDLICPDIVARAHSDSLSSQEQSFPSQIRRVLLTRHHSESIIRTVPPQTEPSPFFYSSGADAPNQQQQQQRNSRVLPFQTVLVDRGSSIADTDLPLILAGDQYTSPHVQYPPTPIHPYSDTIIDAGPMPTGFVAIPSTTAREDSVYEMASADNTSEPREHVQRMTDGWKEDAKGVLIFTGIFSAIVASFITESYKMLSQDVGDPISLQPSHPSVSIIIVNIVWLISLVFNIVSALFATLTLQWSRRFARVPCVPRAPRDRVLNRSFLFVGTLTYNLDRAVSVTIMLLHLSVFLFLVGLVIFFFTIHKTVATVVSVAVGLFGVVYLTLTVLACIDRSCPYRTPLSDVWWSHRERQGST